MRLRTLPCYLFPCSLLMLGLGVAGGCVGDADDPVSSTTANIGGIRGAVFTTLVDGSRVNANIYVAKPDVYLDGGPSGGSPSTAAALSEGDYFFQVTDPSGMVLLSSDHISCRRIHVNAAGVISQIYPGTTYVRVGTTWSPAPCQHAQGADSDYAGIGAITVQLIPYDDTPNPGNEYKAWVTPVAQYTGNPAFVPGMGAPDLHGTSWVGSNSYGFETRFSKTDNFKVRSDGAVAPPCGNGVVEYGEECDDGNTVNGDGCTSTCTLEEVVPPCCGNGAVEAGEPCDDGNLVDGDGCTSTCVIEMPPPPPYCGNWLKEAGETCDDGNSTGGDGCSATCQDEDPPGDTGDTCLLCAIVVAWF